MATNGIRKGKRNEDLLFESSWVMSRFFVCFSLAFLGSKQYKIYDSRFWFFYFSIVFQQPIGGFINVFYFDLCGCCCCCCFFFFFFVTEDVPFALYMFGWMENGEFEIALEESTFCRPRINKTFSG